MTTDLITSLEDWNNFMDQNNGQLKLNADWRKLKQEITKLETLDESIKDIDVYLKREGWQKLKGIINSTNPSDSFAKILEEVSNKLPNP